MKRLDDMTAENLKFTLKSCRYSWNFQQFRDYREAVGVTRETMIPWFYIPLMLEWRELEYNPEDYGKDGKLSEIRERLAMAYEKMRDIRYIEFNAHKQGRRDMSYGRKAVEKKTGAGDWLVSYKSCTRDTIVAEYSRKQSMIHWEVPDLEIDITCRWCELMEYLGQYCSSKSGPERGAAYWFKSEPKESADGDRWILEIQTYRTSSKKIAWIKACPYNKGRA